MVGCTNTMVPAALLALLAIAIALDPPNPKKDAALPPCGACTNLVSSFEAGMERTKRYKTDGGDTAWEEKKKQRSGEGGISVSSKCWRLGGNPGGMVGTSS